MRQFGKQRFQLLMQHIDFRVNMFRKIFSATKTYFLIIPLLELLLVIISNATH
jgi:hypothetical protein